MKIIVLNSGSSSIKYQVFDMPQNTVLAKGLVDKIGLRGSYIKHKKEDGSEVIFEGEILEHQEGIEHLLAILTSEKHGCIKTLEEIDAVGHRVAHGGESFSESTIITEEVIKALEKASELAPLHNPPNLKGVYSISNLIPDIPQVGVFDTAFHQTMPERAFLYGIPYSLYKKHKIRRYGFHGTSHKFVYNRALEILNQKPENLKVVTCHLGNGASMAAIDNGKSIDTSMGLTPLEGLVMGTRAGDLDSGALIYIADKEKLSDNVTNTLINKHSGMLGLSGISSDMREIEEAAEAGNERAKTALDVYQYRVKKYIGAYAAAMGGINTIIFTGGIGENDRKTRGDIIKGLEFLGIDFDFEKNAQIMATEAILTKEGSKVKVMVIPTNEEYMIAKDTFNILNS